MNRKFLSALMVLLTSASSLLGSAFDDANRQFAAGDYPAAAKIYEKVLVDEGPDATVYYNLGNSYQSLKQYGPAILAYERARLLTPRDPDLLANLARARKAAAAFEEPGKYPRIEAAIDLLSRNEWSWLVAGSALVLGCVVVLRGTLNSSSRWMRQLSVGVSVLATMFILLGSAVLYQRRDEASLGIVLAESAAVRLSPFEKAESLGTATPGRIVHLGGKSGNFKYIEVPAANLKGWLADADVAAVTPREKAQ